MIETNTIFEYLKNELGLPLILHPSITDNLKIIGFAPVNIASEGHISWVSRTHHLRQEFANNSKATLTIVPSSIDTSNNKKTIFIIVENPRLTFLRILNRYFVPKTEAKIHKSALISEKAKIGANPHIGPNVYIGAAVIGNNVRIYGNNYIYDNVTIGNNVTIHAGTVIGSDGFGYEKNEHGLYEKFPHLGDVKIEDNVEIGANTCVDRGALGSTIIRENSKIDNLVQVGHNVEVGENSIITAHSMLGGSTKIGRGTWVAPGAILRDVISIGEESFIGMGAVVTKNIPPGEIWSGVPAKFLRKI
jgi:UDP-3-O-[3-hydroxymyristoyl] glucosamine N-acyltransferase